MRRARAMVGICLLLLAVAVAPASGADSSAAGAPPPMGWSSWYHYGCGINEALFKRTAKAIVSSGMAAVGYTYVNIDDCWIAPKRDSHGALQANPRLFPDGISGLASYVHSLRLDLGIYLDAGPATCTGFPGSAGHYRQDASTVAAWGVDYVKLDYCRARPAPASPIYHRFADAIAATHRAMTLNVCDWGFDSPWLWAPGIAISWRTTGDYFSYGAPSHYWKAILKIVDLNASLAGFASPGAYNDPNQLLIGTKVLTVPEERSQFSLWSAMAAPLIAGGDLPSVSKATMRILTNREVIAVDQDEAGLQGTRIENNSAHQLWLRPLADGSQAVVLLNKGSRSASFKLDVSQLGLPSASSYVVRDLWLHRSWRTRGPMRLQVGSHDVRMLRVHA